MFVPVDGNTEQNLLEIRSEIHMPGVSVTFIFPGKKSWSMDAVKYFHDVQLAHRKRDFTVVRDRNVDVGSPAGRMKFETNSKRYK